MLFTMALVVFAIWVLGIVGVYLIGPYVHVILLTSVALMFFSFARARRTAG